MIYGANIWRFQEFDVSLPEETLTLKLVTVIVVKRPN